MALSMKSCHERVISVSMRSLVLFSLEIFERQYSLDRGGSRSWTAVRIRAFRRGIAYIHVTVWVFEMLRTYGKMPSLKSEAGSLML